jgi:hypothetical protein
VKTSTKAFVAAGFAVTIFLAVVVSQWASSEPDGLNKVAQDKGFAASAEDHALDDSPVAGYEVDGVENGGLGRALSGLIGVTVTFLLGAGLFAAVRKKQRDQVGDPT